MNYDRRYAPAGNSQLTNSQILIGPEILIGPAFRHVDRPLTPSPSLLAGLV
jgi:hypothetical protein